MTGLDLLKSDQDLWVDLTDVPYQFYRQSEVWYTHSPTYPSFKWGIQPGDSDYRYNSVEEQFRYRGGNIRPATPDDLVRVMTAILQQ